MTRLTIFCVVSLLLSDAMAMNDTVDEVTVTATRRPVQVDAISNALSVAEADTPLITDALRSAVGVYVQQTTPGQGAAIIRGLKGSSILHTVDGMRLNNAIFRSAPTQYLALVPAAAVERLEVVRGSPTSLYGSDAVGGVVQAVTRKPTFNGERLSGNAHLAFDTAELTRELRATLDTSSEKLAASFSAGVLKTGNRRTGDGKRVGPSSFEAYSGRAIVAGQPDAERRWYVDLQFAEQPETPRFDELVAGFGQSEPDSEEFFFAPNRRAFMHGQYQKRLDTGVDWTTDLAWQRIDDDRRSRNLGSSNQRLEENRSDLFGIMSTVTGGRGSLSWIAGGEFYHDRVDSGRRERNIDTGAEQVLASRFPDGSTLEQAALFANATRPAGDTLLLTGGLRLSDVSVDLAATELTPSSSFDVSDLSGDLGLVFKISDRLQLTANAGLGFRAPNIFDLGTLGNRPGNRFNVPNTTLDSEHVLQVDAGLRYTSEHSRYELVIFHLDYDDRITSVSTGETTDSGRDIVQSVNAAEASVYGVEGGFDVDLGDHLSLHGLLSYARGEQRANGTEEPADRMPPLHGRLRLDWLAIPGWTVESELRFASGQDRLSARDIRDNRINPDGTPGWATLRIGASVDITSTTTLRVSVDNLLDKTFRYHGSGIDAPGRNLSLVIATSWD